MKTLNKQLLSIPIEKLAIGVYQRPLVKSRVKKLVQEFDLMGVGTIPVSKRDDGLYYILDGQHRVAAMRQLGFQVVDCEVYEGMTLSEEAKKFHLFNDSKKNHPLEEAMAKHVAGDEITLAIDRIVGYFGYGIDYGKRGHGIKAYQTLVRLYKSKGEAPLLKTVSIIHQAFGDVTAFNQFLLQGVWDFIHEFADVYDEKELVRRLKAATAEGLSKRAEIIATTSGCSKPKAMKSSIIYYYDRNKAKKIAG